MRHTTLRSSMLVVHPKRPEWGTGKVLGIQGARVAVMFPGYGGGATTIIRVDLVPLRPVTAEAHLVSTPEPSEPSGSRKSKPARAVKRGRA